MVKTAFHTIIIHITVIYETPPKNYLQKRQNFRSNYGYRNLYGNHFIF